LELDSYLIFISVAFFYISSPGLAVFLVLQYSAIYEYKKIIMIILGNITGLAILAFISAIGVGIIISTSKIFTNIIQIIGALVLFYIGFKMIFNTKKSKNLKEVNIEDKSKYNFYKEGLFLALSNPKPIIFFTSIYPQFIQSNEDKNLQFFILAITFMFISFLVLNAYAFISKNTIGKVLNSSRIRIFNIVSGTALIITAILIIIYG